LKQISRHEAEDLFHDSKVISTKVEYNSSGLKVSMKLSEDQAFVVCYSHVDGEKKYYLETI
jgi:hypothetical protein